jgi:murein tripeptide amidase MpaA
LQIPFSSLDREDARFKRRKSLDWNNFWTLDEIHLWMQELVNTRPNDLSIFSIGTSYERNDIKGLRINVGGGTGKPSVFFEATIHATEWLGATSVTYIINEFLSQNYEYLSDFDWYFLPVLNVGKRLSL